MGPIFFFFFACRFFSPGADAGFTKRGGGAGRAAPSIGPRALETLTTPLLPVLVNLKPVI